MPLALQELPKEKIRAVFTDLDDTLTSHSQIAPETYAALWRLKRKGYWLVVVSGRPAGWADCLMRLWPIDAMVFENGAGIIRREGPKLHTVGLASDQGLPQQRETLQRIFAALKKKIPTLKLATDQPYRLFDYAIDYCEEPPRLSDVELQQVLEALRREKGITHKLSSIHVNYWCGAHTKVTACESLLDHDGKKLGISRDQVLYCGDSPNDEPLFAFFNHNVGVANISQFLDRMQTPPRYITTSPAGAGFQEIVSLLLT
jgi:HAD superfamily hydrolase (TIGR01484 family)